MGGGVADGLSLPGSRPNHLEEALLVAPNGRVAHKLGFADLVPQKRLAAIGLMPLEAVFPVVAEKRKDINSRDEALL